MKKLIIGIEIFFLLAFTFCQSCPVLICGKIIGDEANYQTKVIYLTWISSDTAMPNSGYKSGTEKKKLDSISPAQLVLDSTGSYKLWTNADNPDGGGCTKNVDCFSDSWPSYLRVKVYDQKKMAYVIDTVFACSECSFNKNGDEIRTIFIPNLYLK